MTLRITLIALLIGFSAPPAQAKPPFAAKMPSRGFMTRITALKDRLVPVRYDLSRLFKQRPQLKQVYQGELLRGDVHGLRGAAAALFSVKKQIRREAAIFTTLMHANDRPNALHPRLQRRLDGYMNTVMEGLEQQRVTRYSGAGAAPPR